MSSPERVMVHFTERDRQVCMESDLEKNFLLRKEMISACLEYNLVMKPAKNEIPFLAEIEACMVQCIVAVLSSRSIYAANYASIWHCM